MEASTGVRAVNLDGSSSTLLTEPVAYAEWAPGHEQFAWLEPNGGALHIHATDGSNDRVLVALPNDNNNRPAGTLKWSPDGHRIAYFCPNNTRYPHLLGSICLVDVANGTIRNLVDDDDLVSPAGPNDFANPEPFLALGNWSPDGMTLSYSITPANRHDARVMVVNVDSGAYRQIATDMAGNLVFTADGEHVLALRQTAPDNYDQTALIAVTGGGDITDVPGVSSNPLARSPDGNWYLDDTTALALDGSTRELPAHTTANEIYLSW